MSETTKIVIPSPIGIDPEPVKMTAVGVLGLGIEPSPPESMQIPMTSLALLKTPVLEYNLSIDLATSPQANILSVHVPLNDEGPTWRNLVLSTFQFSNFTKTYKFKLFGAQEIKGVFRFDVFDYPVLDSAGQNYLYNTDTKYMRNRHEYWDLSTSNEFDLVINPVCNAYNKARWHSHADANRHQAAVWSSFTVDGTTRQAVQHPLMASQVHPDFNFMATFSMSLDKPITWLPNCPSKIRILCFSELGNINLFAPKSYYESEAQREIPRIRASPTS